eukprot:COSAG02_NODE_5673_length_4139_cov_2.729950_3_plen_55_part_00
MHSCGIASAARAISLRGAIQKSATQRVLCGAITPVHTPGNERSVEMTESATIWS